MVRTVQASAPSSTPISTAFIQPPPSPPPFSNLASSSYQPTDESEPLQRAEFHHSLALLRAKFHQSMDSMLHNHASQNHITAQIAALQSTMVQALTGQHQPIHSTVPPTPSSAPSFTLPPPTLTLANLPPITFESIPAPPLTPANLPPSTFGSIPPPILEGTSLPSLTAQLTTVSPAPPPALTPHPPPLTTGNIPPITFGSLSSPTPTLAGPASNTTHSHPIPNRTTTTANPTNPTNPTPTSYHSNQRPSLNRSTSGPDTSHSHPIPYRQQSLVQGSSNKLSPRSYGPFLFQIRIGKVLHPIFHVSLLKRRIGDGTPLTTSLPDFDEHGDLLWHPEKVLATAVVRKKEAQYHAMVDTVGWPPG